jgi:zinc/manganese transport system substrate-binding protein
VRRLLTLCALAVGALAAGCGGGHSGSEGKLDVVATTTQVGDLVHDVAGKRVEVHTILSPGADPHGYEPKPSDAAALADARLVVTSGGALDGWFGDLQDTAPDDAKVVALIDSVGTIPSQEGSGDVDPHWFQDPRNMLLAARVVQKALVEVDSPGRRIYRRNAKAYSERLRRLDDQIAACMRRVPDARRKLVTTHDSLAYFARRYHVHVVGAVIPSLSTQAQASAKDTERLVEQIREQGVAAIFPETVLGQKLQTAIARETGAEVGRPLYGDTLGPQGSEGATYIGAMEANTAAMVDGMTGGRLACRPRA